MAEGQDSSARRPLSASVNTDSMPGGTSGLKPFRPKSRTSGAQICSAPEAPVRPAGWLSSRPTQITIAWSSP